MSQENVGTENTGPEIRNGGTAPPSTAAPKRGPGRPRKDQNGPASGASPLGETPVNEGVKRGRPKKEKVELDRIAVARQIFGTHMLVASMTGLPELVLSEKEADTMAEAVCDFAREYDFEPDPKVMATINLLAAAGMVYVPRVVKVMIRVKRTKAARGANGQTIDGEASEVKRDGAAAN